jgi:hypothetical protein
MEIKVELPDSGHVAHLKSSITYGESQAIQATLMTGSKGRVDPVTQKYGAEFDPSVATEWTFKKMLIVITRISSKDGKVLPLNRSLIESLPVRDGELLEAETDKILAGLKKKQN